LLEKLLVVLQIGPQSSLLFADLLGSVSGLPGCPVQVFGTTWVVPDHLNVSVFAMLSLPTSKLMNAERDFFMHPTAASMPRFRIIDPQNKVRFDWRTGESSPRLIGTDEVVLLDLVHLFGTQGRPSRIESLSSNRLPLECLILSCEKDMKNNHVILEVRALDIVEGFVKGKMIIVRHDLLIRIKYSSIRQLVTPIDATRPRQFAVLLKLMN
jgi:hypothetical protein